MDPYLRPEGAQLRQGYPEAPAAQPREAHPLELLLAIMGDPRNSWMGGPGKIVHGAESLPALIGALGPLFKSGRGWEVLHEYMQKGGTPKSLRDLLRKRGYDYNTTSHVGEHVRKGTDLAAPGYGTHRNPDAITSNNTYAANLRSRYPEEELQRRELVPGEQREELEHAARRLLSHEPDVVSPYQSTRAIEHSQRIEGLPPDKQQLLLGGEGIPSGTAGQGSYNAIASRMGRLMDDPNFLSLREHYLPPPVSDAAYYAELPIEGQALKEFYRGIPIPGINIEQAMRQQAGLAPPRSSLERMRTSDLNRRADVGEEGQH